jgi:hypothetical protein
MKSRHNTDEAGGKHLMLLLLGMSLRPAMNGEENKKQAGLGLRNGKRVCL